MNPSCFYMEIPIFMEFYNLKTNLMKMLNLVATAAFGCVNDFLPKKP